MELESYFLPVYGTELPLSSDEANFIKNQLGGVILFSKNYENRAQLKKLTEIS